MRGLTSLVGLAVATSFLSVAVAQPPPPTTPPATPPATPVATPPAATVTVTQTVAGPAPTCPATTCFNCNNQGCKNFGTCQNNVCSCPAGFGAEDCGQPTCGSPNQQAANRQARPVGGTCQCDDGFIGVNCNVCTRNDVCKGGSGTALGESLVCNQDPVTWKVGHSYCDVKEPLLTQVFPKESTLTVDKDMTTGDAYGALWYTGLEQFICRARKCQQDRQADEVKYSCSDLSCACTPGAALCGGTPGSPDLSPIINSASGLLKFSCGRGGNITSSDCIIKFDFLGALFPNGFKLENCRHGECALPSDDPGESLLAGGQTLGTGGIITVAAALGLVAAIIAAFALACVRRAAARSRTAPKGRRGAQLQVQNLSYAIGGKKILQNISGKMEPGRALAVMGPSGAGKSTFLDIVAGKAKSGDLDGTLLVNGEALSISQYRRLVGYVDQEDLLMDTLTVRETLMFSANMRLPESTSTSDKKDIVNEVIASLGLSHIADSRIGGSLKRGISGGEKRRVSIGVALVTSPAILFLDEPTSGLDSYNAHSAIKTITDLAHRLGKTVIFTIHQPRSDVFAMFDDTLVLQNGQIMYFGPADEMEDYFARIGKPCPPQYSVADWALDLANGASGPTVTQVQTVAVSQRHGAHEEWEMPEMQTTTKGGQSARSPHPYEAAIIDIPVGQHGDDTKSKSRKVKSRSVSVAQKAGSARDRAASDASNEDGSKQSRNSLLRRPRSLNSLSSFTLPAGSERDMAADDKAYRISFLTKLQTLLGRGWRNFWRRPGLWGTHLGIAIALGAFVGGLYWHSDNSLGGIQNRFGSIFFIMSLLGFSGLSAIGSLHQERAIFIRERANGVYGVIPFLVSRFVFDIIPLRVVPAVVMGSIAFWMVGLTSVGAHFATFIGVMTLFAVNAGCLCLLIACAVRDVGTANLVASIVLLFQMLFAGFLLNQDQIPSALRWIQYLSVFRYAYEALVVNDLSGLTIQDNVSGVGLSVPASVVLLKFGFNADKFTFDIAMEAAIFVILSVLIALIVFWRLRETR
ncbi:uncharacterized protein EV422DRAFT_359919 [Fimicolochytrium jonesii]|uniref:uncharacterized protein n=1 Tax=Fimicolochytrium jonesii TaxID=1396493 RepID=UPI0022FE9CB8|nr:uncharacterized protein EV422DRAFT_359919 [Fimicolochytrium jonesii]KAI8823548.1 hypothetical protein EV422DRAFT_359919 [Fimicolochytrium jonesii]